MPFIFSDKYTKEPLFIRLASIFVFFVLLSNPVIHLHQTNRPYENLSIVEDLLIINQVDLGQFDKDPNTIRIFSLKSIDVGSYEIVCKNLFYFIFFILFLVNLTQIFLENFLVRAP